MIGEGRRVARWRARRRPRVSDLPWLEGSSLFASGSDALAALVRWGRRHHGWRRVWLPSYYCPEVPAALRAIADDVAVCAYPDHDLLATPDLHAVATVKGDVVVVANQLGVRRPPAGLPGHAGVVMVEDHSHDLGSEWALHSEADFAFASLRKTLPIPDGGAVWSPRGHQVPSEPAGSAGSGGVAFDRLVTALDRRERRSGLAGDRLRFRALARVAAGPPGQAQHPGISPVSRALLPHMPVRAWREQRSRNLPVLIEGIGAPAHATILTAPEGGVAFALTLVFDTPAARRRAEQALVARAVVPTVLWPLDPACDPGVGPLDADLSRRILSVHADQRYDEADMRHLAGILRAALLA